MKELRRFGNTIAAAAVAFLITSWLYDGWLPAVVWSIGMVAILVAGHRLIMGDKDRRAGPR